MVHDAEKHHRHSIRLKGYDYSQAGAYFITIVTRDRACIFGDVVDGGMRLNEFGEIVRYEWMRTGDIRPNVELDAFIVMPNHFHGIIILHTDGRGTLQRAPTEQFGKISTTYGRFANRPNIIRNDESLGRIREYIVNNAMQWALNRENPDIVRATGRSPQQ